MSVDDESLNKRVFAGFSTALAHVEKPVVLDTGTGAGAMIRRIIRSVPLPSVVFYGIDADKELLGEARKQINVLLKELGFSVRAGDQIISAAQEKRSVEVHLLAGDLFDEKTQSTLGQTQFSCITTHAFADSGPAEQAMEVFARMLAKGGLLYSTINYDGVAELLPHFEDRSFEELVLRVYAQSSDGRAPNVGPAWSGRTGSLLFNESAKHGFRVIGYGGSDWSIFPWNREYSRNEEVFLNSLLLTIYEEGLRHPEIDRYPLSAWYAARSEAVEERDLALMTHQTDMLAVRL